VSPGSRVCYAVVLTAYFGIMLLLPLWYGWLAPPRLLPASVALLILAAPLFIPLRGLLHARPYTVAWSLFISLIYFTHGIMEAWSKPEARGLARTEGGLSLCWLIAGILCVRSSARSSEAGGTR